MTLFVFLVIGSLLVSAVVMDAQYAASRGWAPLWKSASDQDEQPEATGEFDVSVDVSIEPSTKVIAPPSTVVSSGQVTIQSDQFEVLENPDSPSIDAPAIYTTAFIIAPDDEPSTMTEVGTRLDMARAYVDMGDPAGARSILEEILDEGDEEQREHAQLLLDELAS